MNRIRKSSLLFYIQMLFRSKSCQIWQISGRKVLISSRLWTDQSNWVMICNSLLKLFAKIKWIQRWTSVSEVRLNWMLPLTLSSKNWKYMLLLPILRYKVREMELISTSLTLLKTLTKWISSFKDRSWCNLNLSTKNTGKDFMLASSTISSQCLTWYLLRP